MGNYIPHSFQTPNAVIDDLMCLLSESEFKCYMFATRHINGWQDKIERGYAHISLSMFEHGYSRFSGTGLSHASVVSALRNLVKYGLLVKVEASTRNGQAYSIGDNPNIEGLKARQNKSKSASSKSKPGQNLNQQPSKIKTSTGSKSKHNKTHVKTQDKHAPDGDARPRDLVFDWLAVNMYNLNLDTIDKSYGGRIAKTKRTLSEIHRNNGTELTPAHLDKFKSWWAREYSGLTMPRDAVKLSEYYLEFYGSHKTSPQSQEKRRVVLSMRAQSELGYDTITKGLFNDEIEAKIAEYERMEMS